MRLITQIKARNAEEQITLQGRYNKMKKILLNVYQGIVGSKFGFIGEGNEQWYYFLSLVINCMLAWWFKPEIAILFTIVSVIHFISVFIYGYFDLSEIKGRLASVVYFLIHVIILGVCFVVDWKFTLITSAISIIALLIAPDCTGNNIFMPGPQLVPKKHRVYYSPYDTKPLLFHTIIFVVFLAVTLLLPTKYWVKFIIIVGALILHPIIDILQGECIDISSVTGEAFYKIFDRNNDDDGEKGEYDDWY